MYVYEWNINQHVSGKDSGKEEEERGKSRYRIVNSVKD